MTTNAPIYDRLWRVLRLEVHAIADREPALVGVLIPLLAPQMHLRDALALVLAQRLAGPDMGQEHLVEILKEGLQAKLSIPDAAAQDLVAIQTNDPASRTHAHAFLNYKGFHAVQVARIARAFWYAGRFDLAVWLSNRASMAFGPDIHPAAQLGSGLMLDHGSGIVIGETAVVEDDVTILQNVTLGGTGKERGARHPKVRRGVLIGAGANIIGNIELGAFSKIGAGSVVLENVPANCTVVGIPAKIVRTHRAAGLPSEDTHATCAC